MPIQLSTRVRNARLNAIETAIGASPTLKVFAGTKPANCAAADAGTVLATIALPADWMQDAAGASKAMSGTWEDQSADGSGNATYYRIYASDGACDEQGTVTATGGGGDLQVDNVVFATGQGFKITSFVFNEPNG